VATIVCVCVVIDDVGSMQADIEWRVQDSVRGAMAGVPGGMTIMVGLYGFRGV